MKRLHRIIILVFTFALFLQPVFVSEANAAEKYTYYQTSKKDVPIWSDCSSKSTKKKTIAKKGTVLIVASSKTNSAGNLWYKLKDGNWVFSGNVTAHSHSYDSNSGGYCIADGCDYEYQLTVKLYQETKKYIVTNKDGATIWARPYSGNSKKIRVEKKNASVMIKAETTNERGNLWYQLDDGNWVYSGNVKPKNIEHTHSYDSNSGGYCTVKGCGYEYPLTINNYQDVKKFTVINKDGATIWARPYSGNTDKVRLEKTGATITVKAETNNERGNLWYQLEDGNWVYSGNVELAVGGSTGGSTSKPTSTAKPKEIGNTAETIAPLLDINSKEYKEYQEKIKKINDLKPEAFPQLYYSSTSNGICNISAYCTLINRLVAYKYGIKQESDPKWVSREGQMDPVDKNNNPVKGKTPIMDHLKEGNYSVTPEEIFRAFTSNKDITNFNLKTDTKDNKTAYVYKTSTVSMTANFTVRHYVNGVLREFNIVRNDGIKAGGKGPKNSYLVSEGKNDIGYTEYDLVKQLSEHPEGIEFYSCVKSGGQHHVVITHYTVDNNGKIQFYVVDPVQVRDGNSTPQKLEDCWIYNRLNKTSISAVLKKPNEAGITTMWFSTISVK